MDRRAPCCEAPLQLDLPGRRGLGDEDLADLEARGVERFADRMRALGEEGPSRAAALASQQRPGRNDPGVTRRVERLGHDMTTQSLPTKSETMAAVPVE